AEASAFLHSLPLADTVLGLAPEVVMALAELGVRSVGAFKGLPPAGVGLRFGAEVLALWRRIEATAEPPLRPWRWAEGMERRWSS
ncbi:hypothetical protein ABTB91_20060, partial [Acinetobacter baumannii]